MGLVRKDGYFSITDACIKHCPANFLIIRPPKLFFYYFSLGCEQVGEISRHCLRAHSGLKKPASPREASGRWVEVKPRPGRWGGRAGPEESGAKDTGF